MYLKQAEIKDLDLFFALKCDSNNVYWTGWGDIPKKENIEAFLASCVKNKEELNGGKLVYLVMSDNDECAGYVYIEPDDEIPLTCHIPIGIDSKFCKQGYGQAALLKALEKARQIGYKRMVEHIRVDNQASLCLYRKCGVTVSDNYIMKYLESDKKEIKMWTVFIEL